MKVVIFGANGRLGQALQQVLAYEDIYAYAKSTIDISDSTVAKPLLKEIEPDFIINCAGYTDVEQAEVEPMECRKTNSQPFGWIAPFCSKNDITLINISTNYVYGHEDMRVKPVSSVGFDEHCLARYPDTVYGKSKLLSETTIRQHCKEHYIIRTSWLFGPGNNNLIERLLHSKHSSIDVSFNEWACPTYTFDLAQAIYSLCQDAMTVNRPPHGIYHLVNEGATTKAHFISKILEFAKSPIEVVPVPSNQLLTTLKRPIMGVLINSKRPKLRMWQQALRECMISMGYYNREMS